MRKGRQTENLQQLLNTKHRFLPVTMKREPREPKWQTAQWDDITGRVFQGMGAWKEKHRLSERKPFRTNTRNNTGVQWKRDRGNKCYHRRTTVCQKGTFKPLFVSNLGVLEQKHLLNLLKLLQLVSSATKNAKSAVTYVTICASSLEYLLAGYTTFRKTKKKLFQTHLT